jgi:hypothetical protein
MNTPPSEDIAACGNLSPVVDVDVFADQGIHRLELGDGAVPKISRLWKLRGKVSFVATKKNKNI